MLEREVLTRTGHDRNEACVAAEGIQIHGGIGFTWEHDMQVYFKRAKSSEVSFGDAAWNRDLVARLIGL